MKRPIKFRGRVHDNDELVYGDLIHMTGNRIGIIFDKRVAAVEVDPDSVRQLVGYDMNGNEVYESDVVVSPSGYRDFAEFRTYPALNLSKLKEAVK